MNFKRENPFSKTLLSCAALLCMVSGLSADHDKTSTKEKHPHFAFSYPKDLNLNNPRDFYFYVEGLAMQGMQSNLEYVIRNSYSGDEETSLNGKLGGLGQNQSWDYNFGTRTGWGIYLDHDAWDFNVDWMWINVTNSNHYQAGHGSTLPIGLPNPGTDQRGSAGANWGCTLNVADANLGKPYHISRKVVVNPYFGLRGAWIGQHYNVNFGGTTPIDAIKYKIHSRFFGIGGRVGLDADWHLGRGFKLFSNLSSSLLAGWFNTHQNFSGPDIHTVKLSSKPQQVVPNVDLALGFDWGTHLDRCQYYLNIRAGYEFQLWWNQWNTRQFVAGGNDGSFVNVPVNGDLSLNGFTLKVQLDI